VCCLLCLAAFLFDPDLQLSPVRALVEDVSAVSAGLDFTVWLCQGQVWSAGYPLYGQLGDGSDHMYNAKDSELGTWALKDIAASARVGCLSWASVRQEVGT
jgi:alpha-tubulin suppressor-like RCC1 family protein